MGTFFNIDDEDRDYAKGVFDDMLTEFSDPCKLYYQSQTSVCPNCIINPRTGESTNRYRPDGPVPFALGEICPVCEGTGRVSGVVTYELVYMTIDWTPKQWLSVTNEANPIRIPTGMVLTRGLATDLPKVLRAEFVNLDINNQYISNKYRLYGQPYLSGPITDNRYFYAVWEKIT